LYLIFHDSSYAPVPECHNCGALSSTNFHNN
jgi:hypothetical protein